MNLIHPDACNRVDAIGDTTNAEGISNQFL